MVGAGLEELCDEWLVGFSYELARGLDLNAAYQVAKVSVLQSGFVTTAFSLGPVHLRLPRNGNRA